MKVKQIVFLALISILPMLVSAQDADFFEAKGPVRTIAQKMSMGTGNASLMFGQQVNEMAIVMEFDQSGRKTKFYNTVDSQTYTMFTYEERVTYITSYSKDHPDGELTVIIHLDSLGNNVAHLHLRADTVYAIDSVIRNDLGEVELFLKSVGSEKPFTFYVEKVYEYDSSGREVSMRQYAKNQQKPIGGYDVSYSKKKIVKKYVGNDGKVSSQKETQYLNKDGQIVRVEIEGRDVQYSDFDEYGNWRKSHTTMTTPGLPISFQLTTQREITYYTE